MKTIWSKDLTLYEFKSLWGQVKPTA